MPLSASTNHRDSRSPRRRRRCPARPRRGPRSESLSPRSRVRPSVTVRDGASGTEASSSSPTAPASSAAPSRRGRTRSAVPIPRFTARAGATSSSGGSCAARSGVTKVLDAREIYARRATLPTFVVWGQSTKRADGTWKWWHHTGLFVVDHRDGDRLYRIAADGRKDKVKGYSGDPMRWVEVTDQNVGNYAAAIYRAYGVDTTDGTYGDPSRPIADVDFETP